MSNTLIFVGNLTRDCERRQTQNGNVLNFAVAESVGYRPNEKTNFWNCALFGKRADGDFMDYLKKGSKVKIVGEVSFNENNGKSYNSVRVIDCELVGGRSDSQQQNPAPKAPQYGQRNQVGYGQQGQQQNNDLDEDGLPF